MNKKGHSYSIVGRFFSLMLIAILGNIPCFAETSLVIHLADSIVLVCSLDRKPQMTFGDKTVTLSSLEGAVGEWSFADVESWTFADVEDGVGEIRIEKAQILIDGDKLTVTGTGADKISVYDAGGRLVNPSLQATDSAVSFSIKALSKGTYMLKVGNNSVKFMVQ